MQVGDKVKVKEPFNITYNDSYVIISVKDDADVTCTLDVGGEHIDFASKHLEKES